jgi:hypothetical protein
MTHRKIFISVAIIGGLVTCWIGSEVYYGRSISPSSISSAQDFFARFGDPQHILMVERHGQSYYAFVGRLPSGMVSATPSAPPEYFFDQQGHLVDWDRDPGDSSSYHRAYTILGTNEVEVGVVRQKFGIR